MRPEAEPVVVPQEDIVAAYTRHPKADPSAIELLQAVYTKARLDWAHDRPIWTWVPLVTALSIDPVAVYAFCQSLTGEAVTGDDPWPLLRARGVGSYTFEDIALRLENERTAAVRRWQAQSRRPMTNGNRRQARRRILRNSGPARAELGLQLGGRVVGHAVKGVACPSCGKRSLWWWVQPRRAHLARCNRSSCGALVQLADLGGAA